MGQVIPVSVQQKKKVITQISCMQRWKRKNNGRRGAKQTKVPGGSNVWPRTLYANRENQKAEYAAAHQQPPPAPPDPEEIRERSSSHAIESFEEKPEIADV